MPAAGEARHHAVLGVEQMNAADRAAMDAGIDGPTLMENAGAGAAREILERFGARATVILAGPGNNGGDGFVIARHLARAGAEVRLALLGERAALKGDAALMARRWRRKVEALSPAVVEGADLVVDALFGAGLSRDLAGVGRATLEAAAGGSAKIVAIDVPSGVDGDSGLVRGYAAPAEMTITFFRPKPGHYLYPGRALAGEIRVIDIAIPEAVLDRLRPLAWINDSSLWRPDLPIAASQSHKYDRGHAVVASGPRGRSGAARLAARGALRIGAGLVTVACPRSALAENAAQLTAVMTRAHDGPVGFARLIRDPRLDAVLVGPGNGVDKATGENALAALRLGKRVVLDADAITVFARARKALFAALNENCILTPHEGEFRRLFPALDGGKLARARRAAADSGAVVLLKGPDTVVAAPDGRAVINVNAPATLATAGSGDVLAGFCVGLLAQEMPAFEAAAAACWLHGACANAFGPGLIAEDLAEMLPNVLRRLAE